MSSIGTDTTMNSPDSTHLLQSTGKSLRPHSFLFHPYRTWFDKLLSWVLSLLIPLKITAQYPAKAVPETMAMKQKVDMKFCNFFKNGMKSSIKSWSALYGAAPIVECIIQVPRQSNILVAWGILTKDDAPQTELEEKSFVNVFVRFPISILPEEKKTELLLKCKRSATSGCLQMESFDLDDIPADVPIIVWFHGGGMTLGSFDDPGGIDAVVGIIEKAGQFGTNSSGVKHPVAVLASVQYRLAPEHPFPAAPIDGLSAAAYFLESNPAGKIHVGGISAGGYMGVITALEAYRRYPGRVGSLLAVAPMFGPATNSMSYYLESTAALNCPVGFLRWSWRSYLELDEDDGSAFGDSTVSPKAVLARVSTQKAWEQCKWIKTGARRLIEPAVSLPVGLDTEGAPRIFIVTNRADALHDDGVHMVAALKNVGCFVQHVNCIGGHVIGYVVDSASKEKTNILWSEAVFKAA